MITDTADFSHELLTLFHADFQLLKKPQIIYLHHTICIRCIMVPPAIELCPVKNEIYPHTQVFADNLLY